jgi:helicase associated protein
VSKWRRRNRQRRPAQRHLTIELGMPVRRHGDRGKPLVAGPSGAAPCSSCPACVSANPLHTSQAGRSPLVGALPLCVRLPAASGPPAFLGVWDQRWGVQLGRSRTSRLEALPGWSWDPFADQWEQGFSVLLRYTSREGTSKVKRGHVEGGYKLGNWVGNQRAFYRRGKLNPDQVSRLEVLPEWAWSLPKGPRPRSKGVD